MGFSPPDPKIKLQSPGLGCRAPVWGAEPSPSIPTPQCQGQGSFIFLGICCRAQVPFPAWRDNKTAPRGRQNQHQSHLYPQKRVPPSFTGLSPCCCQGHGHRNPNCCSQSTWASLATTPRALCSPQTSQPGFQRCPCPSSLPVLPQAAGAGALSGPAALPLQPCPASSRRAASGTDRVCSWHQ